MQPNDASGQQNTASAGLTGSVFEAQLTELSEQVLREMPQPTLRQYRQDTDGRIYWEEQSGYVNLDSSGIAQPRYADPRQRRKPRCKTRKEEEEAIRLQSAALQARGEAVEIPNVEGLRARPAAFFDREMPVVSDDLPF